MLVSWKSIAAKYLSEAQLTFIAVVALVEDLIVAMTVAWVDDFVLDQVHLLYDRAHAHTFFSS